MQRNFPKYHALWPKKKKKTENSQHTCMCQFCNTPSSQTIRLTRMYIFHISLGSCYTHLYFSPFFPASSLNVLIFERIRWIATRLCSVWDDAAKYYLPCSSNFCQLDTWSQGSSVSTVTRILAEYSATRLASYCVDTKGSFPGCLKADFLK